MFKESKGIRDIHSLYESIYNTEFNIENQLVSLQETVGFNDLTEDDLIELTDLIESVEFASLTEEEKRNILQKVQDKLATSKKAGFLGQLERTRRKIFGTKKEKEDTKKFDNEHEHVPGIGLRKKDQDDDKDKKIEGPNININKSNSKSNKTNDKTDNNNNKEQDTGSFFKGSGQNPENFKNPEAQKQYLKQLKDPDVNPAEIDASKYFKDTSNKSNNKSTSDDEKGANEWGPGGQPSASKQIDAYKKGRPSPASFKTNQRQTRELIKKQSKEVYPSVTKQDLNQFNRTKKYTADDGSQVERSTVFTKHYKTGKPLGVMTGSQRKAYDKAAAAYKAQSTTPKPEKVPAVDTKPDTYKTNIGAFLNNKKKGDVKDKSRHTKVTSVMDMEEGMWYKDKDGKQKYVDPRVERAKKKYGDPKDSVKGTDAPAKAPKQSAPSRKAPSRKAPQDAPNAPSAPDRVPAPSRPKPSTGPSGGESQRKKPKTGKAQTATQDAQKQQESYDAYDLVLNYIMETEQASSIEEANYIMIEMDQNTIHEIVQAQKKSLDEGLVKLAGLGAAGYGLWKAGKWAKKKGDKALDDARNNMKIGGENRKKEIEKKSGVDLSNW